MPSRVVRVGLLAGCLAVPACAAAFGFQDLTDLVDGGTAPDVTAPGDGGVLPGQCEGVTLPPLPTGTSDAGPLEAVTFGLTTFSLAPGGGLNLDGRCTTARTESSCLLDPNESTFWIDGDAGADIAGNAIVAFAQQAFLSLSDQNLNGSVAYGLHNLLIRLTQWNGTGEDEFVGVVVYASRGVEDPNALGVIDRRTPNPADPSEKWVWTSKVANIGYITGGRLLSHFAAPVPVLVTAQLPGPLRPPPPGLRADGDAGIQGAEDERPLLLMLQDAFLMADVSGTARGSYRLDHGVLAGRLPVENFVAEAARLRNVTQVSKPFCVNGQATVSLIYRNLCIARDLRADGNDDGTQPCDALSVAVSFTSHEADVGAEDVNKPVDPCPTFQTVPCGQEPPVIPPRDAGSDAGPDVSDAGPDVSDAGPDVSDAGPGVSDAAL